MESRAAVSSSNVGDLDELRWMEIVLVRGGECSKGEKSERVGEMVKAEEEEVEDEDEDESFLKRVGRDGKKGRKGIGIELVALDEGWRVDLLLLEGC